MKQESGRLSIKGETCEDIAIRRDRGRHVLMESLFLRDIFVGVQVIFVEQPIISVELF